MPDSPNLLFFFPDQHRTDFVGFDPDVPVETPNLDRLARRGVAFENAVCPSPLCGPSRACLASGLDYDRTYVRSHTVDYPLAAPTYFGRLRDEAGYHVMGCGKFDLQKHSGNWGLDGTNNLAENGFSAGVNNAGYWDAYSSATDGWSADATYTGAADPYMAYLDEQGLAETHIADLVRRRWGVGEEGTDVDATFPTELPEHAYCDNWIARQGLALLEDAPEDTPWHLVVNFAGPHNPWDVTEEMHGWYRDPDVEFPTPIEATDRFDDETHQAVRRNYAAMVENIDRWLGRYLDRLEERGELENTVVVYASDHGEMLGDHGQWYKRSPYQPSVGVPLVIDGPDVASRGVVSTPASVLDLHATLLDYAGLEAEGVDSHSMRPYLDGEAESGDALEDGGPRDVVTAGIGPWRLAFDGRHKLIRGYDTDRTANDQVGDFDAWSEADVTEVLAERPPVLFDHEADPAERRNVAEEYPDVVDRLSAAIAALRSDR